MPGPALSGLVIAAEAGYKPASGEPDRIRPGQPLPIATPRWNFPDARRQAGLAQW